MPRYAQQTEVSPDRSKAEIEKIITRYGAEQFAYGWDGNKAMIGFKYNGKLIRFKIPMPDKNNDKFTKTATGRDRKNHDDVLKAWEQATRQRWRALSLGIKAKLELVESGVVVFEEEFMPFIVLPSGETFAERFLPQIEKIYEIGKIPALLP